MERFRHRPAQDAKPRAREQRQASCAAVDQAAGLARSNNRRKAWPRQRRKARTRAMPRLQAVRRPRPAAEREGAAASRQARLPFRARPQRSRKEDSAEDCEGTADRRHSQRIVDHEKISASMIRERRREAERGAIEVEALAHQLDRSRRRRLRRRPAATRSREAALASTISMKSSVRVVEDRRAGFPKGFRPSDKPAPKLPKPVPARP